MGPAAAAGLVVVAAMLLVAVRDGRERVGERTEADASDPQPQTAVARVVLDPGHGGQDPGAWADDLREASLVLDVAIRLETRLKAETGIEVVLTRRDDLYLSLEARTELANQVDADLFLSIHANASRDRLAGGIATYHLEGSTTPTRRTAAALGNTAAREHLDESRDLAELVQGNLIRGIRELHPTVRDLGVKQERFKILIRANMPSVLTEISFLTNREEAALLSTDAFRDRITDALFQSVVEYQRTLALPPSVADDN